MVSVLDNSLNSITNGIFNSGVRLEDTVTMKIAGINELFTAFTSVSIQRNMNAMAGSFTFSVADKWRQEKRAWPFNPQENVRVYIGNNNPVINGYIDSVESEVSNEDRSITITGRDKTGDLVDSAAIGLKAVYKYKSLAEIANEYAFIFSIKVIVVDRAAYIPFKEVVVQQGETVFELLHRLALARGLLLQPDNEGNLLITKKFVGSGIGQDETEYLLGFQIQKNIKTNSLKQGENVLFASSNLDDTNRFQKYLVKSQLKGTDNTNGEASAFIEATAFDSNVLRQRTKYMIAEKSMDKKQAEKRAQWEATNAMAQAFKASVVVRGWFDNQNKLWEINQIVNTDLRFVGLQKGGYLITGVEFIQSIDQGTVTRISLSEPNAYEPEPEIPKKKKDKGFDTSIFGETLKETADNIFGKK